VACIPSALAYIPISRPAKGIDDYGSGMGLPAWYQSTLSLQLSLNPQTWEALQGCGVDECSELCLEFFYAAPGEEQAEALVAYVRAQTDYQIDTRSNKKGLLAKRTWMVVGQTQPTRVSLVVLNDWVAWMVAAGAQHGGCEFDGWGAEAA
jgi:hypothetical protein